MLQAKWNELYYDIYAYIVAFISLIDELLYRFSLRRRLDVDLELPLNLSGHVAIVTGGTRGLGLAVVRNLLKKGCSVWVGTSQPPEKFPSLTEKIYDGIPEHSHLENHGSVRRGTVKIAHLDLSSMNSIKDFVQDFGATPINYLVCNAGIMFAPQQLTADNFESHLAVNYLGHCLLILELLPNFKGNSASGKPSRIISVSSSTHWITNFNFNDIHSAISYSSSQAYAQSKLAQIMFNARLSKFIREELGWKFIQTFSLHPGVVLSELYEHVHLIRYFPFLIPLIKLITRSMEEGAETILFAALSEELNNVSGLYLEDSSIRCSSWASQHSEDQDRLWELTRTLLRPWLSRPDFREYKAMCDKVSCCAAEHKT